MESVQGRLHRVVRTFRIVGRQQLLVIYSRLLTLGIVLQLETKKNKTAQAMHLLDTVSPLKTLGRGYSIIRDDRGAVVKTVVGVSAGDKLKSQVVDGEICFTVDGTTDKTL